MAKNSNTSRQKKILAGNEARQHAPRGPKFLFLLGWVVVLVFCCSQRVLMKFLSGSQWVFNITLKFPMCSSTCSLQLLTLFHILCPELYPLSYVSNPKEEITTYLFWDCLNQCCVSILIFSILVNRFKAIERPSKASLLFPFQLKNRQF